MNINIKVLRQMIPLVVIIILFVVTWRFGFSKISDVRAKIALSQKNERILTQKLSILNDNLAGAGNQSSLVSAILPAKNPSLLTVSQIRIEGVLSGLTPLNVKSGSGIDDKGGLSRVDVNFDVEGSRAAVFDFLKKIEGFAPITLVEKVKLNEIGGVVRAQVTVKTFYAELPKKLPALTDAISDLTQDEKEVLTEVLKLRQPVFVELPPSVPGERADPFTL